MITHAIFSLGIGFAQVLTPIPAHMTTVSATITTPATTTKATTTKTTPATRCPAITAGNELQPLQPTCEFALASQKSLPDFVCQEKLERFRSVPSSSQDRAHLTWESTGVLKAEVRFTHEGESYANITVNDRPVEIPADLKSNVEIADALAKKTKGTWVVGEFGTDLNFVFDLRNHATFHRAATQPGQLAFNFSISPQDSTYRWTSGNKTNHPGMIGSLWIDPETQNLQRITMRAKGMEEGFPMDLLGIDTTYGFVTIADAGSFLLPETSTTMQCFAGSNRCFRTVLEFHGCRKFGAETRIIMSDSEPPQ